MTLAPFRIAHCELGLGLFATSFIPTDAPILSFTGPLLGLAAVLAKGDHSGDVVQVDLTWYIDTEPPGLYVNHSCDPNAGIRDGLLLVAIRPILPEEQIFFDYSTTMFDRLWTMTCRCGSPNCRGTVLDFDLLPQRVARRYLELGVVQPFIRGALGHHASMERPDETPHNELPGHRLPIHDVGGHGTEVGCHADKDGNGRTVAGFSDSAGSGGPCVDSGEGK